MNSMSVGDMVFSVLVLGIIYACLQLARQAGKSKGMDKDDDGNS